MNFFARRIVFFAGSVSLAFVVAVAQQPGVSPGPGTRYATDAYPGFDRIDENIRPEKKEPKWFGFINGPKMSAPADQLAWAKACEAEASWSKACRAYDALVREWPTASEAPLAQKALADLLLNKEMDYAAAFEAYCYLLDFYSLSCDYAATTDVMYKIAEWMRAEGKTIIFFRFDNTEDVRRAYESLIVRAPGAAFVPRAMLTVAQLREEAGEWAKAVAVYENLRNLHPDTDEAGEAIVREAKVRLHILRQHGYNRVRVVDTAAFLRQALRSKIPDAARADMEAYLAETVALQEAEAYRSATFYDSRTRTKRSAIRAYERFLSEYPHGQYAPVVRRRLGSLKEQNK